MRSRCFVRAVADPSWPQYDPSDDDTFFLGIASAEMAAHYDQIDCAPCGSKDVVRTPLTNPGAFATVTREATGHLFGYALCPKCLAELDTNQEAVLDRVDEAFDEGEVG